MILAIAVLGLSASLVNEKFCSSKAHYCVFALTRLWGPYHAYGTTRYCTFLGIYGILTAAVGTASLFFDSISTIVPLVGDGIGAMFYLAGGIAWVVDLAKLKFSCNDVKKMYSGYFYADSLASTCKRCEADHGLVWALFAFTAGLAICDFLRRRDLVQSSK